MEPEIKASAAAAGITVQDEHIGEGQLVAGVSVLLGAAVDGAVILAGFRVIAEYGLRDAVAAGHVDFGGIHCVRVVLQGVGVLLIHEPGVLRLVVFFTVCAGPSGFLDGLRHVPAAGVGGVLRLAALRDPEEGAVAGTHDAVDAVDVVHILPGQDRFHKSLGTAEVDDDGIPFQRFIDKVIADAADVSDAGQICPVLDDAHLAAHAALLLDLVEHIDLVQAVLGLGFSVDGEHDCYGPLGIQFFRDPFIGQSAADHSFLRGKVRLGLRLRLLDGLGDDLDDALGLRFRLSLSGRCRGLGRGSAAGGEDSSGDHEDCQERGSRTQVTVSPAREDHAEWIHRSSSFFFRRLQKLAVMRAVIPQRTGLVSM